MYYNTRVQIYNNEIQVTHYDYCVNYMTDEQKETFRKYKAMIKGEGIEPNLGFYSLDRLSEEEVGDIESIIDYFKQNIKSDKQSDKVSKQCDSIATQNVGSAEDNRKRSTRRSKQSIYDIARSNFWDYFATFTFKDDRYDYDLCKKRLRKFFDNFKQRYVSSLEYLCVPEFHKDGAVHFHSLLQGDIDAYLSQKGWNCNKFVWNNYNLGICELEKVRDTNRVASYITKYITKDLVNTIKNKRRYMYSKGLKKSEKKDYILPEGQSIYEFIEANFPEYYVSYMNKVEHNSQGIKYIQLKKNGE